MSEQSKSPAEAVDYKDTLNLPQTDFPMRPQPKVDDPLLLERWEREGLYRAAMELHAGEKRFILHVGPPYANGHIHLGHAYNGILKDIITKGRRMAGFHVPVVPGWDCHGLPIEQKVAQEQPGLTAVAMQQACRTYAQKWLEVQKAEFARLGIVMDWEHPYSTMSPAYEGSILRALARMVERGSITRSFKTVAWCTSCVTTLASAEIEYQERKDPSIYLFFPLTPTSLAMLDASATPGSVGFLVWTTTPWTLPLNRAVAVKPATNYARVIYKERQLIVAADLVPALRQLLEDPLPLVTTISSAELIGLRAQHPFDMERDIPVIPDEAISLSDGTACVHVAPGCGPSDYELGVRNSLEVYSPVTPEGKYASGIVPSTAEGMPLADAQGWAIRTLEANGLLIHKGSIRHSYPHCWRCRNGLIFRATKQWFVDLKHDRLQERALQAVDTISFHPPQGAQFLRATVGSRWEWCLSRQRVWGVPIPALICTACDTAVLKADVVQSVAARVAQEGIEYWTRASLADLVGDLRCATCNATSWRKETDILDVWFDSGVSHFAVLSSAEPSAFPADIYVEGIDQYRGWFQSSLLTSVLLHGQAPMRIIMSHGFTVDEKGQKMSKSLGNVVQPQQIIDRLGTDGLRLWVASIAAEGDIVVSEKVLENVAQVYRKIRNTCRFFVQNLFDFNPTTDLLPFEKLTFVDQLALASFAQFYRKMVAHYEAREHTALFHGLADYCTTDLSALYLDTIKDRLYVEGKKSHPRRSAQTVLYRMVDAVVRLIAPVLSFTAEHIADYYTRLWSGSVHLQQFTDPQQLCAAPEAASLVGWWELFAELRSAFMKLIEEQRVAGLIKHPLQVELRVLITPEYAPSYAYPGLLARQAPEGKQLAAVIQELCVVSRVVFVEDIASLKQTELAGVWGSVVHAPGTKCPRCWQWHEHVSSAGLCERCVEVVRSVTSAN